MARVVAAPVRAPGERRRGSFVSQDVLYRYVIPAASVLVFLAVWEWVGSISNRALFARFSAVVGAWVQLLTSGELFAALSISLQALVLGFALAVLVGVPLGIIVGRYTTMDRLTDFYLTVLLASPMITFMPLLILIFGLSIGGRVALVFLFSVVTITVNTKVGIQSVPPQYLELARSMGCTQRQIMTKVLLPGTLPAIFAGLRIGAARAVLGMLLSEMSFNSVGMGGAMLRFQAMWMVPELYAGVLTIIMVALTMIWLLSRLEAHVLRWRPSTSR